MIEQAKKFSTLAHESIDHRRKYTGEPYHFHTTAVAEIASAYSQDPEVIAAAHLHDVLEDVTPKNPEFGPEAILREFGSRVLGLVHSLTDVYTREAFPGLNRAARKLLEAQRLAMVPEEAQLVKLADILDNTRDIVRNDPGFAKVYLAEKNQLLGLMKGGPLKLRKAAMANAL